MACRWSSGRACARPNVRVYLILERAARPRLLTGRRRRVRPAREMPAAFHAHWQHRSGQQAFGAADDTGPLTWTAAFLGSFVGSLLATITALFARGTALETDLRLMATDLYHQVGAETMTVDGAEALLEAARPRIRWWKFGRVRRINRSLDAWLDRFDEAQLLAGNLPASDEETYDVPGSEKRREPS